MQGQSQETRVRSCSLQLVPGAGLRPLGVSRSSVKRVPPCICRSVSPWADSFVSWAFAVLLVGARCCSRCCGLQWPADQPNKDPAPMASPFQGETDDEPGQGHEFTPWSVLRRQRNGHVTERLRGVTPVQEKRGQTLVKAGKTDFMQRLLTVGKEMSSTTVCAELTEF